MAGESGNLSLMLLISAQDQASKVIEGIGSAFGPVGTGIAGITVAAIAAGATAVKMAGDFQMATTTLVTSAGESAQNLNMVRQGILDMSVATGTSTQQLTDGMYMIESAGFHGAAGLTVLKAAAQGAKAENASLGTVANAVTTVLTDYHMSASQAAQATNGLIVTVQHGKTHLQDLSAAMGNVLPLASSLGIAFPQVAGALATMTNSGMSAQRASMNLANAIRSLAAPSKISKDAMMSVGLVASDVSDIMTHQGLMQALQTIEDHVGKKFPAGSADWVAAMKRIMGGATGLNVALMVGGKNMTTYQQAVDDIGKAMKQSGSDVMGWAEIQNNLNFKWDQAKMAVNAFMIQIGTSLLPVVTQAIGLFTNLVLALSNVSSIGPQVTAFFQHNQAAMAALLVALGALSGALSIFAVSAVADSILSMMEFGLSILTTASEAVAGATTMVSTFGTMAGMISASMAEVSVSLFATLGPFLLIGVISGVVILGVIELIMHWGQVSTWLGGVWQNAVALWNTSINAIGSWMKQNQVIVDAFAAAIVGVAAAFLYANSGAIAGMIASILQFGATLLASSSVSIPAFIASLGILDGSLLTTVGTAIADFLASIPVLVAGFGAWAAGASAAATATIAAIIPMLVAAWPIVAIGAAITAAVLIILVAVQHWGQITTWLQAQWQAFATWFSGVWNAFAHLPGVSAFLSFVQSAWNTLVTSATSAWNKVVSIAGSAWQNIKNGVQSALGNAGAWFSGIGQSLINTFAPIWNKVVSGAQSAWQNIKSGAQAAFSTAGSWFSGISQALANAFTNAKNKVQPLIGQIGQMLGNAFGSIWTSLQQSFSQIGQIITTTLVPAWKSLQTALAAVGQAVGGALLGAWKAITQALQQAGQAIGGAFLATWKALVPVFVQIGQVVGGAFSAAWKALVPVFVQIGQAVGGAFSSAWKALAPVLAQIGATVGGAFSSAWKALAPIFAQIGQQVGGVLLTALKAIGIVIGGSILVAISLLLGLIVGLAKGFATLITGLSTTITGIIQIFSGLVQIVSGIITAIVDLCTGHFNKLGADMGVVWKGVQTLFQGVWTTIQGIFQSTIGVILSLIQGFVTTIVQFFTSLYNTLVGHSIVPDMVKAILQWFTQLWTTVITGVTQFVTSILQWFTQMWTLVQAYWTVYTTYIIALVQQWLANIITQITAWVTNIIAQVLAFWLRVQLYWVMYTTAIQVLVQQWLANLITQITTWVTNFIAQVLSFWNLVQGYWKVYTAAILVLIQQWLQNMLTNVQTGWNNIINWITGVATRIENAIETPFQNAVNFVQNLFTNLQTSIQNTINNIINSISNIQLPSIGGSGGSGGTNVGGGSIPGHANGIENFTGGLAYVHQGEVLANLAPGTSVIPSRNVNFGGGSTSIVINAPGRTRNEAQEIADQVDRILSRRYRTQLGTISTGGTSI